MAATAAGRKNRLPREIWILVAAALVIALGYGIVAPVLPQYARSFDVGVMAASAIVSVFALMRLLFAPVGGGLVTRFGERRTYITGLLIVAVSTGLCALAQTYWQLLLFRGVGGVGSVMFTVSAMGLLVKLAPPELRGRTSSLYGTAFLLGNILGPVIGSLFAGFGYQVPFVVYAAALLAATAVVAFFLPETDSATGVRDGRPHMTLAEAAAHPAYRALLVTGFAHGWSNFGVRVSLLPLMAAAVPSIGAPFAGVGLTVFALGNAVAQQATGRVVDDRGRRPVLLTGLLVAGVANLAFGWSTTVPVFLGLSALAGIGAAMIAPASQAVLADVIGRERTGGQALSTYSMASDSGSIAGSLAAGAVADAFGFGWAFALTGMVLLVSILPWLRVKETRPT